MRRVEEIGTPAPTPNEELSPSPPVSLAASPLARRAYAWMALSAVLFATMNFFARLASGHVPWTEVGAARALTGALVAIAIARARGGTLRIRNRRGMWARSLFGTASMLCTFFALSRRGLPLGDTTTLLNLTPVFLAFLTPRFLGEKTGPRVFVALAISLSGVLLVLRPVVIFGGLAAGPDAPLVGVVATFASAFAAFAMMMLRKLGPSEAPEAIAVHFSLTAAVTFVAIALPTAVLPTAKDALYMLLAGTSAGIAQVAMTRAYALERAARVSAVGYLAVATSAALGAIALHEWPSRTTLLGMALVVAGGLFVVLERKRAPAPST